MKGKRLIIMAGLPGSGKSTVAAGFAKALGVPVISVDPLEAAMWRSGIPAAITGISAYVIAEAIAEENLKLGLTVIVDAVNPVDAARMAWVRLAERTNAALVFVECFCSDPAVHRKRIERRVREIAGMAEITWDRVEERRAEYEAWKVPRIAVDTAMDDPEELVEHLLPLLRGE